MLLLLRVGFKNSRIPFINQSIFALSVQTSAQCASTEESVVVPTLKKVAPKASFFKPKNGRSSAGRATFAALSPIRIADKDELADRMKARMKKSVSCCACRLCFSPASPRRPPFGGVAQTQLRDAGG